MKTWIVGHIIAAPATVLFEAPISELRTRLEKISPADVDLQSLSRSAGFVSLAAGRLEVVLSAHHQFDEFEKTVLDWASMNSLRRTEPTCEVDGGKCLSFLTDDHGDRCELVERLFKEVFHCSEADLVRCSRFEFNTPP